jgi:hypothetical protein
MKLKRQLMKGSNNLKLRFNQSNNILGSRNPIKGIIKD